MNFQILPLKHTLIRNYALYNIRNIQYLEEPIDEN